MASNAKKQKILVWPCYSTVGIEVANQLRFTKNLELIGGSSILRINLKKLDEWNSKRKRLAEKYEHFLKGLPIRFLVNEQTDAVYHHFPILTDKRNALQEHLAERGIGTEIHYPNLASTEIKKLTGIDNGKMIQAELIASTTLSLPISQWHSEVQIELVSKSILEFFERNS